MAGYIGKNVGVANINSTAEGRDLLEASSIAEQRDLLDVYSSVEADSAVASITKLSKADNTKPIFGLSGSDLLLSQDVVFSVNDVIYTKTASTVVTLPALVSASDYKVYALSDGTLSAQLFDDVAPANSTELGGFHVYHTTGTINPSSIWDIKYRPTCSPRAMTLSPDKLVWVDIYLMDTDYGVNGYSQGDATIADGSSAPIIPDMYGGDGTTTYGSLTWYEAWDLAIAAGKRLPFYGEFTGFVYGVVEQTACGTDPVTTQYQAGFRSACGVEQVTGCLWQWGADINGTSATGTVSWQAITDGRGSVYTHSIRAVLLGANWTDGSNAGSRASSWDFAPSFSSNSIGARASCDHLILD